MRYISILFLFLFLLSLSCTKEEGVGGQASVSGKLQEHLFVGTLDQGTIGAQGEDVYIIYGTDDGIFDDKVETGYSGDFEFNYLRPGNYTLYAFSDCWSCSFGTDSVVKLDFTISDKKEELSLGNITVLNR
ncbi:MAG: hypothetical protein HOH13_06505 [Crocinitomicaceae bacterium]|jgi:hypothetical protein|nr:hypothetical protein [Crocinitomicaceae bacterium]MBT5402397.1 hypothetical protein [Crocinitomicaceae bacterium]MBT6029940.1 hypothetical protein [Crocinitomicaceae bacterium]MBT6514215.1 hypothetical protein [Crocinitomicaceae bacterium]